MSGGDEAHDRVDTRPGPRLADRLLLWLVGVPLLGVGINQLSEAVGASPWVWISIMVFVVAVVATMPWGGGGFLRWERVGSREPARALAVVLLLGWLGVTVWTALHSWALPAVLLQALLLWGAAVLTCWQTIRAAMELDAAAFGAAFLLGGVAVLVIGVAALRGGNTLFGVAALLGGVAFLGIGVATLRGGNTLFGVAFLLGGVAFLLGGVAVLLGGVAFLGDDNTLAGVAALLVGVAVLLVGVTFLGDDNTLAGVAALLGGVAVLLVGVALLRDDNTLFGVAFLLAGVAFLLVGVAALRDDNTLAGVAALLVGVVALLVGVAALREDSTHDRRGDTWSRLLAWWHKDRSESSLEDPVTASGHGPDADHGEGQ